MTDTLFSLGLIQNAEDLVKVIAIGGGFIVALFWILTSSALKSTRAKEAERTRREIAAYVAEGTISPEQGERMMRIAGSDPEDSCERLVRGVTGKA